MNDKDLESGNFLLPINKISIENCRFFLRDNEKNFISFTNSSIFLIINDIIIKISRNFYLSIIFYEQLTNENYQGKLYFYKVDITSSSNQSNYFPFNLSDNPNPLIYSLRGFNTITLNRSLIRIEYLSHSGLLVAICVKILNINFILE